MAERALVTGASGFIGSHLVRRLVASGASVVALVRPSSDLWRIQDVLDWVELTDAREASRLRGVTTVHHLAAAGIRPGADTGAIAEANVLGTLRLLALAKEIGARRFVYCGSCFEYGPGTRLTEDAPLRPLSEYAASKSACLLLAHGFGRSHGLEVVSVRPFTAYGPFEAAYRLVPSTILSVLDDVPPELTGGTQTRDFVYAADVADGLVAAATSAQAGGGTFNLCTGSETSVGDLASSVVALAGADVELRLGAVPERAVEYATLSGDPSLAAQVLGWRAETLLTDGLARTIDWFREHRARYLEYARAEVRR